MQELIKVATNADGKQVVSARDLHKFLEATERFSNWMERNLQYGFDENVDYVGCKQINTLANQELDDFALTLNCAKEIAMIQRSDKGKQARQYFIECEKRLTELALPSYQIEDELLRAEAWIREKKQHLLELENKDNKIKVLEPKAEFYDTVANTDSTFDFGQAAKMMQLGIGRNTLLMKLRNRKILDSRNVPYQKYITAGYFEIKQKDVHIGDNVKVHIQARFTEKGIKWVIQNKQQLQ
jgi:anti-repressor protein